MKIYPYFLLMVIIITLILPACSKEDEVEYKPKKIYVEYQVFIDSFILHDAIYTNLDAITIYIDSVKPFDFVFANTKSKVIFDKHRNLSIQYIGGYRDTNFIFNEIDPLPITQSEDEKDTIVWVPVYKKRYIDISYAILKITQGNLTTLDTAYYYLSSDFKTFHYSIFEGKISYNDAFYLYMRIPLTNYLKIPFLIQNKSIYMVDIYPYWLNPIDSTEIVYLIQ